MGGILFPFQVEVLRGFFLTLGKMTRGGINWPIALQQIIEVTVTPLSAEDKAPICFFPYEQLFLMAC